MHRSDSFQPVLRALPALLIPVLLLACKDDGIQHYRVAKTAAPAAPSLPQGHPSMMGAPAEGSADMQGDVAAPPHPTGPGTLQWTLPKGWTEVAAGGMRFATLKASQASDLDIFVTVLGGQAGGETANVNRWRSQINLPAMDDAAVAKARKVVKSKAGAVSVYDFTAEGGSKDRLVAGLLATPDGNTWFLKMKGPSATVGKALPDFTRFLESLRLG